MAKQTNGRRKLSPKLRMVADGSTEVNTVRAEFDSAVAVSSKVAAKQSIIRRDDVSQIATNIRTRVRRLKKVSSDVMVNVFIEFRSRKSAMADALKAIEKYATVQLRRGTQATATVKLSDLSRLAADSNISFVDIGRVLSAPTPVTLASATRSPQPRVPNEPELVKLHKNGKGVLIGIIDVQGFDFAHPDFLTSDKKHTRFVRIWDQGGTSRPSPGENARSGIFRYGAEFLPQHMDKAIAAAKQIGAPATDIEPQSQMTPGSHGTHVASIAAGNLGVCPKATLAGVLISLTEADLDRRTTFCDSTRLIDAIEYLTDLAKKLGKKDGTGTWPLSINISLGTNGHAHDGSDPCSRWVDAAMSVPGRCVTVAAGNAGQEKPEFDGDLGYVMGRVHTCGRVAATGLTTDIEVEVCGNGRVDVSENELEIWYGPQDRLSVSLFTPDGRQLGPYGPREFLQNYRLGNKHMVSIYNELFHPANGANYISVYLSPFFDKRAVVGVTSGKWRVRLHGTEIRDGGFHGWIERDDPRPVGKIGDREAWHFPSCFSEQSNVDNSSISSLACARNVIAVANLDSAREKIHITSSQGPTRDAREKPDVAAPGTDVVAARGFAGPSNLWIAMTGTSMASPYITGIAGLMLATERRLTSSQIIGIIKRTSQPLPGRGFAWTDDGGFGCVDPGACLREAASINSHTERKS